MHAIEPYYQWRSLYIASEDEKSPFYGKEYSEFEFSNSIYNYCIHPQWEEIGSSTLYIKLIYADYDIGFCVIELIGEWNDAVHNDIMYLKRNIIDHLTDYKIYKFILIGENVLNMFADEDDYYQEWFDDIEDGWIAAINFRDHVIMEFEQANIDYYIAFGGQLNMLDWRTFTPMQLYERIDKLMVKRLNA